MFHFSNVLGVDFCTDLTCFATKLQGRKPLGQILQNGITDAIIGQNDYALITRQDILPT
jgi:hypothetical protein